MNQLFIKGIAITACLFSVAKTTTAQTKLGISTTSMDSAAILQLDEPNKAFFLTRVSLISATDVITVHNPKAGMIVFNINPAISSTNPQYKVYGTGIYYYDGAGWTYCGSGKSASQSIVNNGLIRAADSIQLGGVLNQSTNIDKNGNNLTFTGAGNIGVGTSLPTNTLEVQSVNVGSNITNGETGQAFNVLAATASGSTTARAIGARGRVEVVSGSTVKQVRGVSGAANIRGQINETATGAYFNGNLRTTGVLNGTSTLTGVAADAQIADAVNNATSSNTLIGGRFGANADYSGERPNTVARTIGVHGAAASSTTQNIGILGVANTTDLPITDLPANTNAGVMAINKSVSEGNELALYADGGVQMKNLNGNGSKLMSVDNEGKLGITTLTAIGSVNTATNGLTKADSIIKLGGTLNEATIITTGSANNLVIQSIGIGSTNIEASQGLNVLATPVMNANKAVALRGRIAMTNETVGQARGVSGAATLSGGIVNGTATGGYFNTNIKSTTLADGVSVTGIAADAEATGTNILVGNNSLMGARFGANAQLSANARAIGVEGRANGSQLHNIGVIAAENTSDLELSNILSTLPQNLNAGIIAIANEQDENARAIYASGKVQLINTPSGAATDSVLTIDQTGNVRRTNLNIPEKVNLNAGQNINLSGSYPNVTITAKGLEDYMQNLPDDDYIIRKSASGGISFVSSKSIAYTTQRQITNNYVSLSGTTGDTALALLDFIDAITPFYSKFVAIYPFTGSDKKFNLVHPTTNISAFYLSEIGSPSYTNDGLVLSSASDKVFTNIYPSFITDTKTMGFTVWTKEKLTGLSLAMTYPDGSGTAASGGIGLQGLCCGGKAFPYIWASSSGLSMPDSDAEPGFHDVQREDNNNVSYRIGPNELFNDPQPINGVMYADRAISLLGNAGASTTIQFVAVHQKLTESEMTLYKNALFNLITRLGR